MPRFRLHRDPTARASDPYVLMTADGKILAGGKGDDRQPVEVDPESVAPLVEARANELAAAKVAASAPVGSAAWLGGLDADAKASFEKMTQAGVPAADAAPIVALPAAQRAHFERIAMDGARAKADHEAALASQREAGWKADAAAFLASSPVSSIVVPAARPGWEAALVAAAQADHRNPPGKDAEGKDKPGVLASVKAAIAQQAPHNFTGQLVVNRELPAGSAVLPADASEADQAGKATGLDRTFELMAKTPEGREAIAKVPGGKAWLDANAHRLNGFSFMQPAH